MLHFIGLGWNMHGMYHLPAPQINHKKQQQKEQQNYTIGSLLYFIAQIVMGTHPPPLPKKRGNKI